MKHPLGSPFVRDQLSLRTNALNEVRLQPDGEFILYWMQSTQRLEDNWALRYGVTEADRIGKPLLIYHDLDPSYPHASERFHAFVLQGAQELGERAEHLGFSYRFGMPATTSEANARVVRLAERASVVVTDSFPTSSVRERANSVAKRVQCRMVAADSAGAVPMASFHKEEYAARTIRPKIAKILALSLEAVEERAAKRPMPEALLAALDEDWVDFMETPADALLVRAKVSRAVGPVSLRGGRKAARARLDSFVDDGLRDYSERRRHPSDSDGSSRLSPYLHYGMISPREVTESVRDANVGAEGDAFLNEMLTWRELSLNFCAQNPDFTSIAALPDWVRRSMARHAKDRRPIRYSLEDLEGARTHDALWNAGQRELMTSGVMHNVVRMLWGKSVLTWAPTYEKALEWLIYLNDKYAIDGRDPNSYAGIQWCFGKFDRPFAERDVWGTIRPMSLERAYKKYDVDDYVKKWSA